MSELTTEQHTDQRHGLFWMRCVSSSCLLNAIEHGLGFDPDQVGRGRRRQKTARAIVYHFRRSRNRFDT